jgi:hypothetical protein
VALGDGRVIGGGEQNVSGLNYKDVAMRLDATDLTDPECTGPGGGPLCGDLSGDCSIKASDALTALKMATGALVPVQLADLDGNGHVTASDALGILRIAVGIDEPTGACNA